jgi:sugar lactone lactonase YvrE
MKKLAMLLGVACVAQGPDGNYYVGELSGAPFNVGAANVYRVSGGQATVYCSGFSFIISMAWGPDGHLYVLQFASGPGLTGPGILYRIDSGCTKTPVVTDLFTPGGLAFGDDGAAYISQGSILASGGTVWRFDLGS